MRGALKQHLDRGKDRSIIIDDENARHGLSLTIPSAQPKGYILSNRGKRQNTYGLTIPYASYFQLPTFIRLQARYLLGILWRVLKSLVETKNAPASPGR
jgi:hypothetical protein